MAIKPAGRPPDAGENAKAENFGGGNAGDSGEGFDEDYTRQAEAFIASAPEPWALIVSLVNPHDVLGYPSSYERGGYTPEEFRGLGVPLPPTIDEDLRDKPTVHSQMRLGMTAYLGPLRSPNGESYLLLTAVDDELVRRQVAFMGRVFVVALFARAVLARVLQGLDFDRRLEQYGGWAWLVGIGLIVCDLVLPVPSTAVIAGLGMMYGPWLGGLIGGRPPSWKSSEATSDAWPTGSWPTTSPGSSASRSGSASSRIVSSVMSVATQFSVNCWELLFKQTVVIT
mgnify:CR=1 FL=1